MESCMGLPAEQEGEWGQVAYWGPGDTGEHASVYEWLKISGLVVSWVKPQARVEVGL